MDTLQIKLKKLRIGHLGIDSNALALLHSVKLVGINHVGQNVIYARHVVYITQCVRCVSILYFFKKKVCKKVAGDYLKKLRKKLQGAILKTPQKVADGSVFKTE